MLFQILTIPRPEKSDAIDDIYESHARIRHYLAVAERLSTVQHASERDIVEAAGSLLQYFSKAFPRHVVDEELSLLPRIMLTNPPAEVLAAIRALNEDHREHEETIDAFCLAMQLLEDRPERLPGLQPTLEVMLDVMRDDVEEHLAIEEDVILPYARMALTPEVLGTIEREMDHRRTE